MPIATTSIRSKPRLVTSSRADPASDALKPRTPVPGPHLIVEQIVPLWRTRQRWHRAEKSLVLSAKAACRGWVGGDKVAASALFKAEQKKKIDDDLAFGLSLLIDGATPITTTLRPFLIAIARFAKERKVVEKELDKLVRELPVWA